MPPKEYLGTAGAHVSTGCHCPSCHPTKDAKALTERVKTDVSWGRNFPWITATRHTVSTSTHWHFAFGAMLS